MATITTYQLVSINPPAQSTPVVSGIYPYFSDGYSSSMVLNEARVDIRTGVYGISSINVFDTLGSIAPVVKKLRGWHTANSVYMYWSESVSTPDGIDPSSIVIVGTF